ncbi:putative nucleotidyltransferase, Hydrolase [Helianthus annuus]|nr:putative nucleotidyltransferase, Hydrolase [Helianthus annuus]
MELMDIKWAFASAVRRAKDYMRRTGRTSLESKRDTKYGFDKDAVMCFNCGAKGHFKRECIRPSRQGNQNPFRNQSSSSNANQVNNERGIVAVNNPGNSNQSGPSNSNRALVVHADEGCDWSVQLGNQGERKEMEELLVMLRSSSISSMFTVRSSLRMMTVLVIVVARMRKSPMRVVMVQIRK